MRHGPSARYAVAAPATCPVWLLQVQLSVIYFFTAVAKLNAAFLLGVYVLFQDDATLERLRSGAMPGRLDRPCVIRF